MESLVNDLQTNFLFGKCCRFERGRNSIVSGGGAGLGVNAWITILRIKLDLIVTGTAVLLTEEHLLNKIYLPFLTFL